MNTYWLETKFECLALLRMPGKIAPLVLFPLAFYCFFGLTNSRMAGYLLGTYGAFGVMGAALIGIGAGLSVERGLGWLQVKRATPMSPASHLLAKMVSSTLVGLMIVLLLLLIGVALGGVRLSPVQAIAFIGALALGSIPFCALGLAVGYFASSHSVNGVVNLIYLPMAFCSGLWMPLPFLPKTLQAAAPALPSYHLAQTALAIIGQPSLGTIGGHVAALAAFTALFAGIAWWGYTLDESRG